MALEALESAARVAVALLSIFVFVVGLIAYSRRRTGRMLLVLALFVVFLVEGLVLLYEVFVEDSAVTESAFFLFQAVEVALVAAVILTR